MVTIMQIRLSRIQRGPISGSYRILRGGSWKDSDVEFLRVAYRSQLDQPLSINTIGFRCAKDAR